MFIHRLMSEIHGSRRTRLLGLLIHHCANPELFLDLLLNLGSGIGILLEESPRVFLTLTKLITLVGVPRAGLADKSLLDANVNQRTLTADALAIHDVELGLLEWRGDF